MPPRMILIASTALAVLLGTASSACAQVVAYYPSPTIVAPVLPAHVTVYRAPMATTTAMPAPVTSYSIPMSASSVTAYSIPTAPPTAPTPVMAFSVPVTGAAPAMVPVAPVATVPIAGARPAVIGTSVSGRPQVYVPGQPLRNTLRAISP